MFKRILVPLDGSKLAEMVLPTACYLAERLQATLILFHVAEKLCPRGAWSAPPAWEVVERHFPLSFSIVFH